MKLFEKEEEVSTKRSYSEQNENVTQMQTQLKDARRVLDIEREHIHVTSKLQTLVKLS